jgi:hypothetical protein
MLSLPQKAMAGLASALVVGALVPAAASAASFRFNVQGQFAPFSSQVSDFTGFLHGGSFSGEIVVDSLPAPDGGSNLESWDINLFRNPSTSGGSPFPSFTFSSVLPPPQGQGDRFFVSGSLFGGSTDDIFSIRSGTTGEFGNTIVLQLPFAKGFQGDGPIISGSSALLLSFEGDPFGPFTPPTGVVRITSGFAQLISGPTLGNIDFDFDFDEAELNSQPTLVELEAGLSVEDLSYSLEAPTTGLQEFWDATRGISVSWTEPTVARIFGSTTISLDGAASELEFFVQGLLNDDPFDLFTTSLSLADGASQLVEWDLAQIVDLVPGDYTLALTSGVRWQPASAGSVLTVSSQYGADVAPVPTPALLPGLVGMGVAALRKRRQQGESDLDENLIDLD